MPSVFDILSEGVISMADSNLNLNNLMSPIDQSKLSGSGKDLDLLNMKVDPEKKTERRQGRSKKKKTVDNVQLSNVGDAKLTEAEGVKDELKKINRKILDLNKLCERTLFIVEKSKSSTASFRSELRSVLVEIVKEELKRQLTPAIEMLKEDLKRQLPPAIRAGLVTTIQKDPVTEGLIGKPQLKTKKNMKLSFQPPNPTPELKVKDKEEGTSYHVIPEVSKKEKDLVPSHSIDPSKECHSVEKELIVDDSETEYEDLSGAQKLVKKNMNTGPEEIEPLPTRLKKIKRRCSLQHKINKNEVNHCQLGLEADKKWVARTGAIFTVKVGNHACFCTNCIPRSEFDKLASFY